MTANKTYIGKGHKPENVDFDILVCSICVSEIPKDKIFEAKNGKKYLRFTIARMKEPDKYNETHTIYISDYKPETNHPDNLPF
jgi:hypothetical protein